jgi:hypothetical protein
MKTLLLLSLLFFSALPAFADETYVFTGPNYSVFPDYPCPSCGVPAFLSGSFTTSLTPAQLANLSDFVIPNYDIVSFNFTDNNTVDINQGNAILAKEYFQVSTDANGQILPEGNELTQNWTVTLANLNDQLGISGVGEDWSATATTYGQSSRELGGGTWLGPTDPAPQPTPEAPTVLSYIFAGLVLIVIRLLDKWRRV